MKPGLNAISYSLVLIFMLVGTVHAVDNDATELFKTGRQHYENEQYDLAIPPLEKAIALVADAADYHHILAKSYGREAERVNWFSAMNYAKKTLKHLEIAANLDRDNLEILDDLMEFYREAPGFLGGDPKKADAIQALIEQLNRADRETGITRAGVE